MFRKKIMILSKKLNISLEESSGIKYIETEQIYREDKDEKKHNTPKFQIDLLVRDNSLITIVQTGLISYFNNNEYIKTYQRIYNETNNDIINSIDEEIKELRSLRNARILQLISVHTLFYLLEMRWIFKIRL